LPWVPVVLLAVAVVALLCGRFGVTLLACGTMAGVALSGAAPATPDVLAVAGLRDDYERNLVRLECEAKATRALSAPGDADWALLAEAERICGTVDAESADPLEASVAP
jgi:hypothetical protein